MEDIPLFKLSIESSIKNYDVFFTQSAHQALKDELNPNDIILVDKNVFSHLNDDMKELITEESIFLLKLQKVKKAIRHWCL